MVHILSRAPNICCSEKSCVVVSLNYELYEPVARRPGKEKQTKGHQTSQTKHRKKNGKLEISGNLGNYLSICIFTQKSVDI